MHLTRRSFTQLLPSAAMAAPAPLKPTGRIQPRPSRQVAGSRISLGFETLDRKMFDPQRCYALMAQTGVKWARCQTGWARTERRRGEYDFAWLDSVVDSLLAIGIQPWFNLGYGNSLYTPGPQHETAVGWAPLNSDEAKQGWARYVERMGQHFGQRVRHWEIWNEPHHPNFWKPNPPDPAGYVDLVKLTAPALRKSAPGCVLIGGVFPLSNFSFVEGCFEAGLGDWVDRFSYHPYRAMPEEGYDGELRTLRGIVNRYKPGTALWQGESGAPSSSNSSGALGGYEWDEVRQAKWLLRRLLIDLASGVELVSYFHTVDMVNYVTAAGVTDRTNFKGILRGHSYTPKVAYYALQNLCALFDSETAAADFLLSVESPRRELEAAAVRTATFIRRGAPVCAFWYPADLQEGWQPKTVRVEVWMGKAARLTRPVLADLLTGLVYPVEPETRRGLLVWNDISLRDYPLLLTDESVIPA